METPSAPKGGAFSLAATFPIGRRPRRPPLREAPLHIRQDKAARWLARKGAMEPEGCPADVLQSTAEGHALTPAEIKEILTTLWSFRLLGWSPVDPIYLRYNRIRKLVRHGVQRPADTIDYIAAEFAAELTAGDLERFRRGLPR
jgi:hypothetical protein